MHATPPPSVALSKVVLRLSMPVFVFGMVFLAAAVAVTFLASPDRFPVRVGDKVVRMSELSAEQRSLTTRKESLRAARAEIESGLDTPVLDELAAVKARQSDSGRSLRAIGEVVKSFALAGASPIVIDRAWFSHAEGRLQIAGRVQDGHGRSNQILAAFVDALRAAGRFSKVSEPEYVSTDDPTGASVSPFSISLSLADDQ